MRQSIILENMISAIIAVAIALVVVFLLQRTDILRADILGNALQTAQSGDDHQIRTVYSDETITLYSQATLPIDEQIHVVIAHNDDAQLFLDYSSIYEITHGDYASGMQQLMLTYPSHGSSSGSGTSGATTQTWPTDTPLLQISVEGAGNSRDVTIGSVSTRRTSDDEYTPLSLGRE